MEKPKGQVFDAALSVAQELNLNVAVLEKESGFLRFEMATLTPWQLDKYCQYPFVDARTQATWDTFQNWNQRSLAAGDGPVRGTVSLTLLMSDDGAARTKATLRGNWTAQNNTGVDQCNSLGVLEGEFETSLRSRLGLSPR